MIPEISDYSDVDDYYADVNAYFEAKLLDQQVIRYADLATV